MTRPLLAIALLIALSGAAIAQILFPNMIPFSSGGGGGGTPIPPPFVTDDVGTAILTDDPGTAKLQAK